MSTRWRSFARGAGALWTVDEIADLHAGALTSEDEQRVRAVLDADPEAMRVYRCLESVSEDVRGLDEFVMPPEVAARIDTTLHNAANSAVIEPLDFAQPRPTSPQTGRRKSRLTRRRVGIGAGVVSAAAATLGIALLFGATRDAEIPQAQEPRGTSASSTPLALRAHEADRPSQAVVSEALRSKQYGALTDTRRLRGCLAANGIEPSTRPMGGREVNVEGRSGVLLVLPTGELSRFRLLTVGADCDAGNPSTISDITIG